VLFRSLHVFVLLDKERGSDSDPSLQFALSDSSSSDSSSSDITETDISDVSDSDLADGAARSISWPVSKPSHRSRFTDKKSSVSKGAPALLAPRKTHMIASETFAFSVVLRLLDRCHGHERVRRAALFNLEARVGNQICSRNYSSTWLDLSTDILTAMLSDSRFGYPESKLFSAAEAWLLARAERCQSPEICSAVLRCIRYPLLPIRELYDVQRNSLIQTNEIATKLVLEAMRYHLFYDCSTVEDRGRWCGGQFKLRVIPQY